MIPPRPLFAIAGAVLALHAIVLGWASLPLTHTQAATPLVFQTRTLPPPAPVSAQPATTAQAPSPSAPAPAQPPKRKKPRPPAAHSSPTATAAEGTLVAAAPPTESAEAPPADTPEAQATPPMPAASDPATTAAEQSAAPALDPASAPATPPAPPGATGIAITAPGATEDNAKPQSAPVRIPAPVRLEFEVQGLAKRLQYSATGELLWQHNGHQYQAKQEIRVLFLGSRSQTSVGQITALGLQPERFTDRARKEQSAHFDFAKGQVAFSSNAPTAPIAPGAQDRLSVFLQLAAMLAAAPQSYPVGTSIRIPTISTRAADWWTFTIHGEETLHLPMGTLPTLLLERQPRRDDDLKAQVWLAPGLNYLPARIRLTQANGDMVELNLRAQNPL